jgi:hypothetical protein
MKFFHVKIVQHNMWYFLPLINHNFV